MFFHKKIWRSVKKSPNGSRVSFNWHLRWWRNIVGYTLFVLQNSCMKIFKWVVCICLVISTDIMDRNTTKDQNPQTLLQSIGSNYTLYGDEPQVGVNEFTAYRSLEETTNSCSKVQTHGWNSKVPVGCFRRHVVWISQTYG